MPRKVFTAGEVLTAADTNTFLSDQVVMTFAGTAARGSAIPTPIEGMLTYLADTDAYETFDGAAFVKLANPMTTEGDLIYGGTAGVAERIGIGDAGEVLTVVDGNPAWFAAGGGGGTPWELLNPGGTATALTGASTITVSDIGGFDKYFVIVDNASAASNYKVTLRINSIDAGYRRQGIRFQQFGDFANSMLTLNGTLDTSIPVGALADVDPARVVGGYVEITGASESQFKSFKSVGFASRFTTEAFGSMHGGILEDTATLSSISLISSGGNFDAGSMFIYGA